MAEDVPAGQERSSDRERAPSPLELLLDRAKLDLGWIDLLERIATRARAEVARAAIRELEPATSPERARERMTQADQALRLLDRAEPIPVDDIADVSEVLARMERGALASAAELAAIARLLEYARRLRKYARAHRDSAPELCEALATEPALDGLLACLEDAIEPNGDVRDRASERLRGLRHQLHHVRGEIERAISRLQQRYLEVLREPQKLELEGRYVLAVRADAHYRVQGIVLGSSASGATLYLEPAELTPLSNRLRLMQAEEEREVARIVADLGARVVAELASVEKAFAVAIDANVWATIAEWTKATGAVPLLVLDEPGLELFGMRHPLLVEQGAEVVANDLALQPGSALVISGPNAGGKTVALKCMGLAAWMARSGLPITATPGSRVGWFDHVLTDVGDDQSVLRSLSTFSGHIKKLAAILEHADSGALVLLDEVASGTDPEEGSALAGAILAALTEKGAAVAVTTHYERLKELAAEHERFENASVGFDFAEMAPTFKLTLGIPGPSSALAVAARFGMPQAVLERARSLLSKTAIEREQLVRRLQERELLIDEIHRQAEADVRHQTQVLEQMRSEQENAQERERVRMASEARQLMDSVRTARARLRQVEQRLRQESSSSTLREAEREIDRAAHEVALGSPLASAVSRKAPASTSLRGENLEPGMMVIWTKSGATGEVLQAPERGLVKIRAGALKIAVPVEELAPAKAHDVPRTQRAKPRVVRKPPPVPSEQKVLRSSDNTLDLRGLRVEEALDRVDAFVDRLMARGEPAGFVLHGHGTGALKSAVRQHLAANHFVRRAEPAASDDGGDAFTLLRLVE